MTAVINSAVKVIVLTWPQLKAPNLEPQPQAEDARKEPRLQIDGYIHNKIHIKTKKLIGTGIPYPPDGYLSARCATTRDWPLQSTESDLY